MSFKLNDSQQKTVDFDYGSLLVIAGAGTGKTRVITERIKRLLQTNSEPDQIVALTFTDKSANEMLERLGDVMPLGYQEPWIYTFHRFSDRILKLEGLEIGLDPAYKIISYPEQWLLLRKNIFKLDLNYFRPLSNPTKFISAILKFISRLQDENISVEKFNMFAQTFSGDPDEKTRWKELAYIYKSYQDLKIKNSKMDFGDLILWNIKLFKERPNILKKYQNQFKHILVDEFQDTNFAQYQLIKMLCPSDIGMQTKNINENQKQGDNVNQQQSNSLTLNQIDTGTNNQSLKNDFTQNQSLKQNINHNQNSILQQRSLMVVGDDSQSIYKFRGAAISNILQFKQDYPTSQMVTLIENYRSNQHILDSSYKLIQNNNPDTLESKLGISKELVSKVDTTKNANHQPQILYLQTINDEVEQIMIKIHELLESNPDLSFKDFAILSRAKSHLEPIVLALRKHDFPYQLVGNRGLYDRNEVRDVIALIRVLINPYDSISLYRVLSIESLNIDYQSVVQILSSAKIKKVNLWDVVLESTDSKLDNLKQLLSDFQSKMTKYQPHELIYEMVKEINYLNIFLQNESTESQLCIKNLNLFLEKAKRFESDYHSDTKEIPTIVDFIDYIDLMIESGDNPAQAEIEDIDTINLMTIHSSKGLEFEVVFVINVVSDRFPTRNRKDVIMLPPELISETLPTGDEHIQEERRLFYVAMTRAKQYLYLTLAKNYGGVRDKRPSGFLQETGLALNLLEHPLHKIDQASLFGVSSGYKTNQPGNIQANIDKISYSQLNKYQTCPLSYKYAYVLNVPTEPNASLNFGTAIHETLYEYHYKKSLGKDLNWEQILEVYKNNWVPLGYLNKDHSKLRFEEGEKLLRKYYEKHKDENVKHKGLEKWFDIKLGNTKFTGKIDRIDMLPNGNVEIIDYKTGESKDQKYVDKDQQLAFYTLGATEGLGLNVEKLSYYYLEDGVKLSTTRTKKELEKTYDKAVETIEQIKKSNFEHKSGMHCLWCDYKDICPYAYKE